jgi:hypothetical protein
MDRKEYIRNSCGITAKKITPYSRDMDKTPRLTTAEKKAVRVRLKSLQPTPKMTTAEKNAARDRLNSQNTKNKTVSLPPLNFRNVAPAVDTNDIKLFDNLRGQARLLRVANSNTIQDAKEANKQFNYRYIKNLQKNRPF